MARSEALGITASLLTESSRLEEAISDVRQVLRARPRPGR
jgi:hypothetical protein